MELTPNIVLALIQSEKEFPVDFDVAWQWIGYTRKNNAKDALEASFDKGFDFCCEFSKNGQRGRPLEKIFLTIDCFKQFCMMAGLLKGNRLDVIFCNAKLSLSGVYSKSKHKISNE